MTGPEQTGPEQQGYDAGQQGIGIGACPFPPGVKATAWRQGYLAGQRLREIEEQEVTGHFRDGG